MNHIKMYEKFVRDNKLHISYESANDFCDLLDEDGLTYEFISDEYVEYANGLKTKKAKMNNLNKSLMINRENLPAQILQGYFLYETYGNIPLSRLNGDLLDDTKLSYDLFLEIELNKLKDTLINKHNIDLDEFDGKDNCYYLSYESRLYLWVLKMKYMYELEIYNFDGAITTAKEILKLNNTDNFLVSQSLPYILINLNRIDEAVPFTNYKTLSKMEKNLLKIVLFYLNKEYDEMLFTLDEIRSENEFLYNMLITGILDTDGNTKEIVEARIAYYSFTLIGDSNIESITNYIKNNLRK